MKKRLTVILLMLTGLLMCAGFSGAEELLWPHHSDLLCKDWRAIDSQSWVDVGDVTIVNDKSELKIVLTAKEGFMLRDVQIHVTQNDKDDFVPILNKKGKPIPGKFTYKTEYPGLTDQHEQILALRPELDICWGNPEYCPVVRYIVVHAELVRLDAETGQYENIGEGAYGFGTGVFLRDIVGNSDEQVPEWGWYIPYTVAKVEEGHFVDAKVNGLTYKTPTQAGITGVEGNFQYIPKERVEFWVGGQEGVYLGSALADRNVSPLDLFEGSDLDDNRVLNVARLLQSLQSRDEEMKIPPGPMNIAENIDCLQLALNQITDPLPVDFRADTRVTELIDTLIAQCPERRLVAVTMEAARAALDQGQRAANLLKTNVSKNPGLKSDKAKLEIMPVYVPSQTSDGNLTDVVYYSSAGDVIETRQEAKPVVVAYQEEVEGTGASDVFVAISRDDGGTWKRRNISKTAGKSSFKNAAGAALPGDSKKPMLLVKGNKILVAWTDKYCKGGRPGYAIKVCPDTDGDGVADPCEVCRTTDAQTEPVCTPDYPGDDAYWQDDIYGVAGPQRSVVYDPVEFPEQGEVAYSCVWAARGLIAPDSGEITWFKPERLTSGRRDANQVNTAATQDAGFAIAWQEDPEGLQPPSEYGPGDGWSGANVSNKTDVWYSFLKWEDFDKVDAAYVKPDNEDIVDTDPELAGRAKALVPFSLPVKVTDNDVCSLENMAAEGGGDGDGESCDDADPVAVAESSPLGDGTHRYCGEVNVSADGSLALKAPTPLCAYTIPITNHNGVTHNVCVSGDTDPRVLDGNTGASRPNLFLQPYKKSDGTTSAWAILGYEESKGMGTPPEVEGEDDEDRYKSDLGKNVIYHSFDFTTPEKVSSGGIINLPETNPDGSPVYAVDELGAPVLDPLGRPQMAYENARRIRLLQQPKKKALGTPDNPGSGTVLLALYRQGEEGHGKPADIFMRRMVVTGATTGNPYAFKNFVHGAHNLSSVTPGELWEGTVTDPVTLETSPLTKMVNWDWDIPNLSDASGKNPYSDGLAHRGAINGDEIIIGYGWTPNWGRLANDKYDLYIRRSFDGGQTWTTDKNDPEPIEHVIVFVDPDTKEEIVTSYTFQPGDLEPPRNVSGLRNNRVSVLEPRIVKTPGNITRPDKSPTGYPEDTHADGIYQVAWGMELNDPTAATKMPLDIYYGRTIDKGQRYETVVVTPKDGSGTPQDGWNLLAKDRPAQSGAQLRQTPDGSRMYAIWLEEGESGSDIMFRRVDYR